MRNPDLPKLLRALKLSANNHGTEVIYEQAAIELEKLEKIYKIADADYDSHIDWYAVRKILKDGQ